MANKLVKLANSLDCLVTWVRMLASLASMKATLQPMDWPCNQEFQVNLENPAVESTVVRMPDSCQNPN